MNNKRTRTKSTKSFFKIKNQPDFGLVCIFLLDICDKSNISAFLLIKFRVNQTYQDPTFRLSKDTLKHFDHKELYFHWLFILGRIDGSFFWLHLHYLNKPHITASLLALVPSTFFLPLSTTCFYNLFLLTTCLNLLLQPFSYYYPQLLLQPSSYYYHTSSTTFFLLLVTTSSAFLFPATVATSSVCNWTTFYLFHSPLQYALSSKPSL